MGNKTNRAGRFQMFLLLDLSFLRSSEKQTPNQQQCVHYLVVGGGNGKYTSLLCSVEFIVTSRGKHGKVVR